MRDRGAEIHRLRRRRPRSRFLRWSGAVVAAIVAFAWLGGDLPLRDLVSARRIANLQRFLGELRPHPLQGEPWDWGEALTWAGGVMAEKGWEGALITLWIAVLAIVLAGGAAAALSLLAARTVASAEPYLPSSRPPGPLRRALWGSLVWGVRALFIFLRAIPEYVLAFLLLGMLGPTAWAAVLALALHNTGILGKLDAEVVENAERRTLSALRAVGAGRLQIASSGIFPAVLGRYLLFFFYRWETCVREATVLGMLGIVSLGFWIQDARARNFYDEMFLLVLVGAAIVVAGDLVSALARSLVRRAA